MYFNLPKQRKKRSIDERIQDGIQRFMKEETERIVRERDDFWAAEMAKLKVVFSGKNIELGNSPNVGSQQGSCSKGAHAIVNELELQGIKKQLDLDNNQFEEENVVEERVEVEVEGKNVEVVRSSG